jgi:predicted nucleic acid-binding protein
MKLLMNVKNPERKQLKFIMKKAGFVLDTNIWISAIITNSETKLQQFILELKDLLKKNLSKSIPEYILLVENTCLNKTSPKHYDKAPDKDDNFFMMFA